MILQPACLCHCPARIPNRNRSRNPPENVSPTAMFNICSDHIGSTCQDTPDTANRIGATNRKENSSGSVIPVSMDVSAAENKKTSNLFLLLRLCGAVHCKCCTRKTEDHKDKLTGEISCRVRAEMRYMGCIGKLCKEDILSTLYHLSGNFHAVPPTAVCQNGI